MQKKSIILLLLWLLPFSVQGQTPDSTAVQGIFSRKMQPRFRPMDEKAPAGRFFDNTYLFALGSYYRPFADNYGSGPLLGGGIGKWFSDAEGYHRYHGVRLGASLGYFYDNYDADRVKFADVRASYLFDLSAYVGGYRPDRLVSLVPVAGLGFAVSEGFGRNLRKGAFSAHLGLDAQMHVLPGVDIIIEPLLELQRDTRRLSRLDIWRKYLPVFRGNVGLSVNLDRKHWIPDPGKEWSITFSGGVQLQDPQLTHSMGKKFYNNIGPYFTLGVIRKYRERFDWRLVAGYGSAPWSSESTTIVETGPDGEEHVQYASRVLHSEYAFVRLDAVARLFGPFYFLIGPEAGLMHKENVSNLNPYPYVGVSGGLQFKLRLSDGMNVFLEPRVTLIPYSTFSNLREIVYDNYWDMMSNLSLGMEYRLHQYARSQGPAQPWTEGLYAWLYGSTVQAFSGDYGNGIYLTAGVGKWFGQQWAVRSGAGAGYYFDHVAGRRVKELVVKASYLYNLLPNEVPVRLGPVVGAGISAYWTGNTKKALNPTAHVGLSANLPLLRGVNLVLEPMIEASMDQYYKSRTKEVRFQSSFVGNVGVDIALGGEKWGADPGQDWAFSLGGGVLFWDTPGPVFSLGAIRHYGRAFSWRFTGNYGSAKYPYKKEMEPSRYTSARMEAGLDMLALGKTSRRISFSVLGGPEAGLFRKRRAGYPSEAYVGLAAGLQLKGHVTPSWSIYLEPHVSLIPYSDRAGTEVRKWTGTARLLPSVQMGVEYSLGGK